MTAYDSSAIKNTIGLPPQADNTITPQEWAIIHAGLITQENVVEMSPEKRKEFEANTLKEHPELFIDGAKEKIQTIFNEISEKFIKSGVLDKKDLPELVITNDPKYFKLSGGWQTITPYTYYNATEKKIIAKEVSIPEDELRRVLGHELAHHKSEISYKNEDTPLSNIRNEFRTNYVLYEVFKDKDDLRDNIATMARLAHNTGHLSLKLINEANDLAMKDVGVKYDVDIKEVEGKIETEFKADKLSYPDLKSEENPSLKLYSAIANLTPQQQAIVNAGFASVAQIQQMINAGTYNQYEGNVIANNPGIAVGGGQPTQQPTQQPSGGQQTTGQQPSTGQPISAGQKTTPSASSIPTQQAISIPSYSAEKDAIAQEAAMNVLNAGGTIQEAQQASLGAQRKWDVEHPAKAEAVKVDTGEGWKPDFNKPNPYEDMPEDYAGKVAESYKPTVEIPLNPVQTAALEGKVPLYDAVNKFTPEQKSLIGLSTIQELSTKINESTGQDKFDILAKAGFVPQGAVFIPTADDKLEFLTKEQAENLKSSNPELYAILTTEGFSAYEDAIQDYMSRMDTGDGSWKPNFNNPDPYADIPENLVDTYFVKLDTGEYILQKDFKQLNPYQQGQLIKLGIEKWNEQQNADKAYQQSLLEKNNMIIGGQMMPIEQFNKLPRKYQDIALSKGYDAMYSAINADTQVQNDALAGMKSISGVYDEKTDTYDVAKYLSKGGSEDVVVTAGFGKSLDEAKKYNYDTRGIGLSDFAQQPSREQYIQDYFKEKGWELRALKQEELGDPNVYKDFQEKYNEAYSSFVDKYMPHVSEDDFVKNYFEDKGWEYKGTLNPDNANMRGEYTVQYNEATGKYINKYGKNADVLSGIAKISPLLFAPTRSIAPEVQIRDISGMEFAMGGAQIALMATPVIAGMGKFGGLISKGVEGGATAVFGKNLADNWDKGLSVTDKILGVGGLILPAVIGIGGKIISRARPGTITGEALSLSEDVGRPIVPEGMSSLAARQLLEDVEKLNLKGTIPANELRALDGVPNVAKVTIIKTQSGATDIVLKSMDGNIVGHVSGAQRVFPDTIYSAVPDTESFLKQSRQYGIDAVRKEAIAASDTKTISIIDQIINEDLANKGFATLLKTADKDTIAVLKRIYDNRGIAIKNLGKEAHYGFFASPQASQSFMYDELGTPSPGLLAIRMASGELKELPKSVLDSATLAEMRGKMEELANSGKLESGIYPLYKGYRDTQGNLRLEYELYSTEPTVLKIPDATWYARGEIPKTSVTSLIGFEAPTKTSRGLSVGDSVPMYWLSTEKALSMGKGVPPVADFYASKILGDLTLLRKYAPWNLRFNRELAGDAEVFTNSMVNSSFKQIKFENMPNDTLAGRTTAVIRNENGDILLVRQKGQKRYDLPGGGVPKIKTSLKESMAREVYEETGLQVRNLEHIDTLYSSFNPKDKLRRFQVFDVDAIGKPSAGSEIAEIIWWDGKSKLNYPIAEFAKGSKILSDARLKVGEVDLTNAIVKKTINTSKDKLGNIDSALLRKNLKDVSESIADDVGKKIKSDEKLIPYKPDTRIVNIRLSKLLGLVEDPIMQEKPDLYGTDLYEFDIPKKNSIVYDDEMLTKYEPAEKEYSVVPKEDIKILEPQLDYEKVIGETKTDYLTPSEELPTEYKPLPEEPTTEYKPPTDEIAPEYIPPTEELPSEYKPPEYEPPTEYKPPAEEPPVEYKPPVEEPPTEYKPPIVEPPIEPPKKPILIPVLTEGEIPEELKNKPGTICFPAGMKVLIAKDRKQRTISGREFIVKDIICTRKIEDIKIGDKVLSYNEITAKKEIKVVTEVFCRQSKDMVLIKFSNRNEIKCTPEHPIAVIDGGGIKWVNANELKENDLVIQYKYAGFGKRNKTLVEFYGKERAIKAIEAIKKSNTGRVSINKGKTLEEIYGKEKAEIIKQNQRNAQTGNQNFLGHKHSEFTKKKISDNHADMSGDKNGFWGKKHKPETIVRFSKSIRKRYEDDLNYRFNENKIKAIRKYFEDNPEVSIEHLKNLHLHDRPNKSELRMLELLKSIMPNEYEYNGGGNLGIVIGGMIPDFWNINGKKKVIEYFGSHWHDKEDEQRRKDKFSKFGIECLIVWDYELKNISNLEPLKEKILTFTHNPDIELVKVVSVERLTLHKLVNVYNIEVEDNHNYFVYGILVHNCWRQGAFWEAVPPPYNKIYHLSRPLPGTYKFATGKGSAAKTLQVLYGKPEKDVDLDLGWARVKVFTKGGKLTMSFGGGKEAVEGRWAEERQKELSAYERQSYEPYDGMPQEYTERIPRQRVSSKIADDLGKVELPELEAPDPLDENKIVKVYAVNDDYVRTHLEPSMDFVAGHHWSNSFIPEDEIWLGKSIGDKGEFFVHEFDERPKMAKGMEYEPAHEHANEREREVRGNPELLNETISEITGRDFAPIESGRYDLVGETGLPRRTIRKENSGDYINVPSYTRRRNTSVPANNEPTIRNRRYLGYNLRPPNLGLNI